jgi:hypothetical protein
MGRQRQGASTTRGNRRDSAGIGRCAAVLVPEPSTDGIRSLSLVPSPSNSCPVAREPQTAARLRMRCAPQRAADTVVASIPRLGPQ